MQYAVVPASYSHVSALLAYDRRIAKVGSRDIMRLVRIMFAPSINHSIPSSQDQCGNVCIYPNSLSAADRRVNVQRAARKDFDSETCGTVISRGDTHAMS